MGTLHHKMILIVLINPIVLSFLHLNLIFDVPKVVETFRITLCKCLLLLATLHILQPFTLADANHNNLLLVDTLHLLQTPRLVDIFHNNLFLLLVDTLRVPMVGNTLHNNLCPFLDTLHLVQVPMVVDTFL